MIQFYELRKKIQSSDPVVQLGIIPLIGSITSIAFLILKSLGNLQIAQGSILYSSALKKHNHKELLIFSLPVVGTVYLIHKLSEKITPDISEQETKKSLDPLQKKKEPSIEMVQMYLKIKKVQNAVRAYILKRKQPAASFNPKKNQLKIYSMPNYKLGLYMLALVCVSIYLKSYYDFCSQQNLKY